VAGGGDSSVTTHSFRRTGILPRWWARPPGLRVRPRAAFLPRRDFHNWKGRPGAGSGPGGSAPPLCPWLDPSRFSLPEVNSSCATCRSLALKHGRALVRRSPGVSASRPCRTMQNHCPCPEATVHDLTECSSPLRSLVLCWFCIITLAGQPLGVCSKLHTRPAQHQRKR
jgi:hypothetical protein